MDEATLEKDWWAGWRAADYSWEGLAKKEASDGQTLQDYWRDKIDDLGGLIDEIGRDGVVIRQWTPFHLPYFFENGTPTPKSSWTDAQKNAFQKALEKDLMRALDDGRGVSWDGIVAPIVPPIPEPAPDQSPVNLDCWWANLTIEEYWRGAKFGAVDFTHSRFERGTSFCDAQFNGGDAYFWNAQFSGHYTNFGYAQFSGGHAAFGDAQFSGGIADFESAQFSGGQAIFSEVQFSGGPANFGNAQFSGGDVYFWGAQFSGGNAYFDNAQFNGGDARFSGAQFSGGPAHFDNAQFSGGHAYFGNAQFSGGIAFFGGAQFSGGGVNFNNAQFSGGDAFFGGAQFSGGGVNFNNAQFSGGDAYFFDAKFTDSLRFSSARFRHSAKFMNVDWPENPLDHEGAFSGVRFEREADLTGDTFTAFAAFNGAIFERSVVLSYNVIHKDEAATKALAVTKKNVDKRIQEDERERRVEEEKSTKTEDDNAQFASNRDSMTTMFADQAIHGDDVPERRLRASPRSAAIPLSAHHAARKLEPLVTYKGMDEPASQFVGQQRKSFLKAAKRSGERDKRYAQHFTALEGGARALKIGLEQGRDNLGELRMYRLELLAKRNNPDTPLGQKYLSQAYALFGQYGFSPFVPLVWAIGVMLVMGFVYSGWYSLVNEPARDMNILAESMAFSAQALFKPFSYWGYEELQTGSFGEMLIFGDAANNGAGPTKAVSAWHSIGVRLVASLQSIFSIVMLFLSALSARRFFQLR